MSNDYQPNYITKPTALLIVSIVLLMVIKPSEVKAKKVNEELISLNNVYHYGGLSTIRLVDPYLSILDYIGVGAKYQFSSSKFLDLHNPVLAYTQSLTGIAALTINNPATASVSYLGATTSWGLQYYYRRINDFLLLGGANIDLDIAYKMNSRNVNNPITVDLATNLNLNIGARYYIQTKRRRIQLNALVEFPAIGCMFVPSPGISYYELHSTNSYAEAIHFSALHNKQGSKQNITVDIPFKHTTWSFGIQTHNLKYKVHSQVYSYSELTFLTGITYDMIKYTGLKANVPEFFISPKH